MKNKITFEAIQDLLPKKTSLYYVDYNDSLDEHTDLISQCISNSNADTLYEKIDEWYIDSHQHAFEELDKELNLHICKKFDIEINEAEEVIEEFREEIREHYYNVDDSNVLKELVRNSSNINVRITKHSNYDCINSHWFETQCGGYQYKETYFGAMVDTLKLNPRKVKEMLISKGLKAIGSYPNYKYREGKELVSYTDFWQELENSCCGANNLVFVATLDIQDLIDNNFELNNITIPKGNSCGLFSSFQGGGSVIEMELLQDFKINLSKNGKTKYDNFSIEIDGRNCNSGYSIEEAYGVTNSFWGNEIKCG